MKEERMASQTASDEYANDGANGSVSIRQMFDFFRFVFPSVSSHHLTRFSF